MRTLVIGDIHGGFKALKQALDRAEVDYDTDIVIQLGDVCDGWSQTYDCVEELLKIENLIPIQGNHDQTFYQWLKKGSHPYNWDQGALATIKSYAKALGFPLKVDSTRSEDVFGRPVEMHLINMIPELIPDHHRSFFSRQIDYYKDGRGRVFTHGGFNRHLTLAEQRRTEVFAWDRKLFNQALSVKGDDVLKIEEPGVTEIFLGHTSTTNCNKYTPMNAGFVWNLDTGGGGDGYISIMDVDTKEYWQSDKVMDLYPDEQLTRYMKLRRILKDVVVV